MAQKKQAKYEKNMREFARNPCEIYAGNMGGI
jgi:hypothetical protein